MNFQIPQWETLRIIGRSKVVSVTILVPFIGYLILFNNELVAYFSLSKELLNYPDGNTTIPSQTISRLYFLYYGLTILGLSSIAFSFFCPAIIKAHKNDYEYSSNEIKIKTYVRMSSILQQFAEKLDKESDEYKQLESHVTTYHGSWKTAEAQCGGSGFSIISARNSEIENDAYLNILCFNWGYFTNSLPKMRLALLISYTIGFLLVLYPSFQVFLNVSLTILKG